MEEQRVHIRKLVHGEASIADQSGDLWCAVQVLDISHMGVAFASAEKMDSGVTRMFRFFLPGSTERHTAVVKVVHCSDAQSGFRIGARFASIKSESKESIITFIAAAANAS